MGRPRSDNPPGTLKPLARRRALRAVLSALAGGGLTAGLGGPLASNALALEAGPASAGVATTTTNTTSATETTPQQPASTTETTTTPSTAPAGATSTSTTPAGTTTATTPQTPTEAPTVVLQKKQKASRGSSSFKKSKAKSRSGKKASAANNVAESPQIVADAAALEAILDSSNASAQALEFYRIPLFMLPIYKAAAVQYGVPWQILAAINEIETDYGSDLSVSSAGAVGWMQFMPATWLQYGVDALNAGYADPYNPVDAVFAAARYLRAAGAATNLKGAILAYNHSEEYVASVLLRAKLIATYPATVIATLTGLIDGRLPVTGKQLAWSVPGESSSSASGEAGSAGATTGAAGIAAGSSSATANALPAQPSASATNASTGTPGASAPSPAAAAADAHGSEAGAFALQLADLTTAPDASVVAVQDGRVIAIGHSTTLGTYLKLRDVYGDVFTYGGLGSVARSYVLPKPSAAAAQRPVVEAASTNAPTPKGPASAGTQRAVTLQVKTSHASSSALARSGQVTIAPVGDEGVPAGMGRVRLYAHPGNPDARAAASVRAAERARSANATRHQPLRVGSVLAAGTVLGRVLVSSAGASGHLRFAIQPAGDQASVDPGPVLANWAQLQAALHPHGATATNPLLGATASDVLLLSQSQLERAVLSDPEIQIYPCGRQDIAAGVVNRRVLAVIAFLARSGLEPTVSALRCDQAQYTASGALSSAYEGDAVTISAINSVPIAHHQGAGTITDLTIRTLLTLPHEFVPQEILSLMRYPETPSTRASADYWNQLQLVFAPPAAQTNATAAAHSARRGHTAPSPLAAGRALSATQWEQLMTRVAALPFPTVSTKRSSAAVSDPKKH
jgi:membrane-bound lytic murein transglycosylase B